MKTTAPLSYKPQLTAMRAAMLGSALAQIYPDRARPSLEQLAAMADAHQTRMAHVAAELRVAPTVAAAKRASQVRRFETLARNA